MGLYATGTACTKKEESAPVAPALRADRGRAAGPPATPPPGANAIKGTVKLKGAAPEMKMLKREADPYCGRVQMKDEEVVVSPSGGIKNVLVRLTKGVTGSYPAPATPATIDQTECMYRPRVQGIVAGQTLAIENGDPTLHNVHTYKGTSTLFNQAQVPGTPNIEKKFTARRAAQVQVRRAPVDDRLRLGDRPSVLRGHRRRRQRSRSRTSRPGTYTIEAWHERFGSTTAEVTVSADKPGAADLSLVAR